MDADSMASMFVKRAGNCPSGYIQSGRYCYSVWHMVVRWVVLGICLLLLFLLIACFIIRRRRSRRATPATAWTGQNTNTNNYNPPNGNYYPNGQYGPNGQYPYQPGYQPPAGTDYYAGDQINMPQYGANQEPPPQYVQQPQQSYQPPVGPPPGK